MKNSSRFSRLFEISLIVIVMAIYLYAALAESHSFVTKWFLRDDAFYYFKVAQNITEGRGSTLDGINPTNGYHPLWMLICIPIFSLARFDLILPLRVLVLVSGAISAATGVLLFRLVGRTLSAPAAVLAASYWVFNQAIHSNVTQFGLETGLTALTMTAFLLAMAHIETNKPLSSRQSLTLGLLAVAMTFSRLDTVFLAALAGAWILLRGTPIRTRLMLDVAVIVSAAFVSVALRIGLPQYFAHAQSAVVFAAVGLVAQIPVYYFGGMYTPNGETRWKQVTRFTLTTLAGTGITSGLMIGLLNGGQLSGLPRSALLLYAGFVFAGAGIIRLASRNHPVKVQLNWRQWFGEGVRFYGILGGALAAYMLFNKILFGTFMPVSGQIKAWWGSLQGSTYGNPISTFSGFLGLERAEGLNAWGPIMYWIYDMRRWLGDSVWQELGLILAALLLVLATQPRHARRASVSLGLPLLLAGSLAQLFYYNGQGYAGAKDWYWVSQMLMVTLLGALLFDLITRPIRQRQLPFKSQSQIHEDPNTNDANKRMARIENAELVEFANSRNSRFKFSAMKIISGDGLVWTLTAALCIGFHAIPFARAIVQRMPWGAERASEPYMDVLPFLESNTEEGALIGMTGGGNVGYFIQRRIIVNMDGLINSTAYYLALRAGRADEYLAGIGLDYIFSNPDILQNPPYNGQFDEWSEEVAEFGKKDLLRYSPR